MQIKYLDSPSIFIKGFPCIRVMMDSDQQVGRKPASVIRHEFRFLDCNNIAQRVKQKYMDSVRGVVVDIRNVASKKDVIFIMNIVSKWCWHTQKYKTHRKSLEKVLYFLGKHSEAACNTAIRYIECANVARNLASEPPNKIGGPRGFYNHIEKMFGSCKSVSVELMGVAKLKRLGLGILTGMDTDLLIIDYKPRLYNGTVALVGTGICFDSCGANIEKNGASIVVAAIKHVVDTKSAIRVVGAIPLIKHRVSVAPGDVLTSCNQLCVEIVDHDDRKIIVADTLAHCCDKYKPDLVMDVGVFTGCASRMHCSSSFAYFTLDDTLDKAIVYCGEAVGERGIRLPPWTEYIELTGSQVADLKNVAPEFSGEGNMAALFLLNFIPKSMKASQWIHFDLNSSNSPSTTTSYCNGFSTCVKLLDRVKLKSKKN